MSTEIKKVRSILLTVLGLITFLIVSATLVTMSFEATIVNYAYFAVWAVTTAIVLLCVYFVLPNINRRGLLNLSLILYCIYLACFVLIYWNTIIESFSNLSMIFSDPGLAFAYYYPSYVLVLNILLLIVTVVFIFFIWKKKVVPMILMYVAFAINVAVTVLLVLNMIGGITPTSKFIEIVIYFGPTAILMLPQIFVTFAIAFYISKLCIRNRKLEKAEVKNHQNVNTPEETDNTVKTDVNTVEEPEQKSEIEQVTENVSEIVTEAAVETATEAVVEEGKAAEESVDSIIEEVTEKIEQEHKENDTVKAVDATVAAVQQAVEEEIECPECHNKCKTYQKFCTRCGHKLIEE